MRTRALVASALVLTLATACGDPSGQDPKPDSSETPSAAETSSTATPTIGADHVVDMPGPISGVQAPPDIMVVGTEPLSDALVHSIEKLDEYVSVERMSLVQTVIENQSFNIAAVDPATYRNYTARKAAQTQAIWERVAGGELALEPKLEDVLPTDANDFVTLAPGQKSAVHVGAYAQQVVQVDGVVNETWIDDLGMVKDNALLVRTGQTAPKKIQEQLQDLIGTDASVSLVDKATRFGVDPGVKQVAITTGTVADVVGVFRYSVIGGGRIAPEQSWVSDHIITKTVPILGEVTCNKYIFPQLEAALKNVIEQGRQDEIHPGEYAGCYYPRFIAGTTKLSNHSFGLALDLNVPGNQRGTVGEMDRGVVAIFKYWGFAWGGDWGYTDPMHFEMVELKDPKDP
jgi:hypothetical protein